jgi:hypothetical protein
MASLFDAYHVPKLLSLQLLPFGRSGDVLEELTREVELFLLLSVRRGQSACAWQTVREVRVQPNSSWCSSCSCFVRFNPIFF